MEEKECAFQKVVIYKISLGYTRYYFSIKLIITLSLRCIFILFAGNSDYSEDIDCKLVKCKLLKANFEGDFSGTYEASTEKIEEQENFITIYRQMTNAKMMMIPDKFGNWKVINSVSNS